MGLRRSNNETDGWVYVGRGEDLERGCFDSVMGLEDQNDKARRRIWARGDAL